MSIDESYLKAILATVARQTFPLERLAELVAPTAGSKKQIAAYNLCNGEHSQTQIASAVKLDKGNLNRSISRWEELGIIFRVNNGGDSKPMHVYPLVQSQLGKRKGKKNGK
jgi:DNA-binding MarR family transcriptional regulator